MSITKSTRVNERIRVPEVRLIGPDGEQIGIVPVREALSRARDQGFDLVEVAPKSKPPVCRIMDFGKFLYQQKKKAQESKRKQKTFQIKEVKFRPKTDQHDYGYKLRNVLRFLDQGDKVKTTVQFRGRERSRTDLGEKLLARVAADVGESGVLESHRPEMSGNRMHVIFSPAKQKPKKVTAAKGKTKSQAGGTKPIAAKSGSQGE